MANEKANDEFRAEIRAAAEKYLTYIGEQVHLNNHDFIEQIVDMFMTAATEEMDLLMVDIKEAVDQALARYRAYNGLEA